MAGSMTAVVLVGGCSGGGGGVAVECRVISECLCVKEWSRCKCY